MFAFWQWLLLAFSSLVMMGRCMHRLDHPEFPVTALEQIWRIIMSVLEQPYDAFVRVTHFPLGWVTLAPGLLTRLLWGSTFAWIFMLITQLMDRSFKRRYFTIAIFLFFYCFQASAQGPKPQPSFPDQFVLGVYGQSDFGPPFMHYELYVVRSSPGGASLEHIVITPEGQRCIRPARIERATGTIKMSAAALMDNRNPCDLAEEDVKREIVHCTTTCPPPLGGGLYVMRAQCGSAIRTVPLNARGEDIFRPYVGTPKRPLSIIELLLRLDSVVGPLTQVQLTSLDSGKQQPESATASVQTILDLKSGKYDDLSGKPSDLYRSIERSIEASKAEVELESFWPIQPEKYTLPIFPRDAKKDSIDSVSFALKLDADGKVIQQTFFSGQSLFQQAVQEAAAGWQFPKGAAERTTSGRIDFGVCPVQ
jgi:hypothetical protein